MTDLKTRHSAGLPAAAAGTAPAPPPRHRPGWRRQLTPWLYLSAALVLLVTFTYIPVANMISYSFTDWDGVSPDKTFVGADNYVELFTRPELFQVFFVSLYYLAAAVLQIVVALYFATILTFKTRFRNLFKGLLFFPYLINGVAVAFVFLYFFKQDGTLDSVLAIVGAHPDKLWLGDPDLVNVSLSGVSVWRFLGLNFVLFLGAMQSIPAELHEAAEIDGASKWQVFRSIIAPSIRPIIGLSVILSISGSLSVFEIPFIMTRGFGESKTFVIQTVKLAFDFNKMGLASAMAVVLLAIILLITWAQRRLVPDERADRS
ncbi:multiple sugar transport system permease protein [Allocatelliglobosispora scoriae]|uniref:Multiple sugar transport system permease protein n=1 Tax=Allocatelliglobosispora scoriae TaxID=643052 RepID=A0A841BLB2_9ACTN|nr:sugar ABC transporter permease [Allocatelliglobosispora scoriae]MBB5867773.1 multiple sugar transport system permease protein [Allocatelliglobosispora scoriae]